MYNMTRSHRLKREELVTMTIDELDVRLIGLLRASPNLPVVEMARRLDVARGTVQARLDRLIRSGVITGFGPDLDPAGAGFGQAAGRDGAAETAAAPDCLPPGSVNAPRPNARPSQPRRRAAHQA